MTQDAPGPDAYGEGDAAHVGSVLFPLELVICLSIFALLESGCAEV